MSQPIRVLHVVTIMNLGGIENFLMTIYRNIDRTKIQFDFLVHRDEKGAFDDEIISLGGKIIKIQALNPLKYFSYTKALKQTLKQNNYKIIHSHLNANSAIVLKVAKGVNIKTRIAHAHTSKEGGRFASIKKILQSRVKKVSTINIACSNSAGQWLFGNNEFIVINNSIDSLKFKFNQQIREQIRMKLGLSQDDILIGNIASFTVPKNHMFLLEVFKSFIVKTPYVKLILIGDGHLKHEIVNKIKDLNLESNVILTGNMKNVSEFLNALDVFLFPSLFEGLPVALVEAQCNGLPILMSDTISNQIQLTDLVKSNSLNHSSEDWSNKILQLYKDCINNNRETYQLKIAEKGYDVKLNVKKLEHLYLNEYHER